MKIFVALLLYAQKCFAFPHPSVENQEKLSLYPQSPHSIRLKQVSHPGISLHKRQDTVGLIANHRGPWPALPVSIGSQEVYFLADLGSSNFWVIDNDFKCYQSDDKYLLKEMDQSSCIIDPLYTPDHDFVPIEDRYFDVYYSAGRAKGSYGSVPVTLGNLTLQTKIGLADKINIAYLGSELSGILGLAFRQTETSQDSRNNQREEENLISKLFQTIPERPKILSMALSRDESGTSDGGIITFGGLPSLTDPTVNVSSDIFTISSLQRGDRRGLWDHMIDGYVVGGQMFNIPQRSIIDSGGHGVWLPADVAATVNDLWVPPVRADRSLDCNAQLSKPFGLKIGDAIFNIRSSDLNLNVDGDCFSVIFDGGDVLGLGMPFLKNVLAVFDYEKAQMVFYPRPFYSS